METIIYCDENSRSKSDDWKAGYLAGKAAAERQRKCNEILWTDNGDAYLCNEPYGKEHEHC